MSFNLFHSRRSRLAMLQSASRACENPSLGVSHIHPLKNPTHHPRLQLVSPPGGINRCIKPQVYSRSSTAATRYRANAHRPAPPRFPRASRHDPQVFGASLRTDAEEVRAVHSTRSGLLPQVRSCTKMSDAMCAPLALCAGSVDCWAFRVRRPTQPVIRLAITPDSSPE